MERYNRNISIKEIGESGQKKLLNAKILIAGAGGLGSSVISGLASVGLGNIGIIDYDCVELSDLNRQFIYTPENIGQKKTEFAKKWIKEHNPDINVEIFDLKLDKNNGQEIISRYDIVIDCFDSYESKFLLNELCIKNNKIFIHGGVAEFCGQVMTVIPGKSACLNCILTEPDGEAYVLHGIISPTVSMIASIQSAEAVKAVLCTGKLLTNRLLTYDSLNMNFRTINIAENKNCPLCANLQAVHRVSPTR